MEKLIQNKFIELSENGELDRIITKATTDFIDRIVRNSLEAYGDVTKVFKDTLNTKIIEGFDKLDFVQYSKTLTDLVESQLNKTIIEIAIEPAKKMIADFVGALEKKEWKLSEIIEKYKQEEVIPEEHGESGKIAFFHEMSEYGSIFIGFDETTIGKSARYQCKYKLMLDGKTKKMYSPMIDGNRIHPITEMGMYGFDLFLFKLYAMNCTIECDIDNIETEWSTYND